MTGRLRSDAGFSLIEVVVVAGLILIFMVPVYRFIDGITQSEQDTSVLAELATNSREAMDTLVRELRQANSGSGSAPVQSISPTLRFLSPDRETPFHARRIEYRVTGPASRLRLERQLTVATNTSSPWTWGTTGPWETAVDRLATASSMANMFTFRNAAGAVTSTLSQIRTIEVQIRFDPVSGNRAPNIQTYRTTVEVRNKTS